MTAEIRDPPRSRFPPHPEIEKSTIGKNGIMTRKSAIIVGSIFTVLCAVGFIVGIALLVAAHGLPAHSDEARPTELTIQYEQHYIEFNPEEKASIEREMIPLRTSKWKLYNAGLALCLTTPILLVAIIRFKLWDIRMLRTATTPRTKLRLLGLASVAWLGLLPAILLDLDDAYAQDDLTWAIDTGHGAFSFIGPTFFLTTWIALMLVGRYILLRKAHLPANLWNWDSDRPRRSLTWTVLYGFLGGVTTIWILCCWSTQGFGWGLPSLITGLYVIVSTRAALPNPK